MGMILIGGGIVAFIWIISSSRRNFKAARANQLISLANDWFEQNGLKPHTVRFNTFSDSSLVKAPESEVLIGIGKDAEGSAVGFAIEVSRHRGLTESIVLNSPKLAMNDKSIARSAKLKGVKLMDEIRYLSEEST